MCDSGMDKIKVLKIWLENDLTRFRKVEDIIEIINISGESSPGSTEHRYKFKLYTNDNVYTITAIDRSENDGYLGAVVSTRKSIAGEDWTRGRDLADGDFSLDTWQEIKNDIIAYELVFVVKIVEK